MLRPTKPSSAGSSVIAASIVISTAEMAPTATLRMKSRFIMNMPSSEMTTVMPAKTTARPDVSSASDDRLARLQPVVQGLAVAGDDQQRVVDADADADHRRDRGRELGHREEAGDEADEGDAAADAEQRGDDRQAHRQQRAEGDQQDDDGGDDADELAGELGLLGEDVAAELDLQALRQVDLLPELAGPPSPSSMYSSLLAVGEVDLGVGDLAVLRDLVGVCGSYGLMICSPSSALLDLGEERLHRLPHGRVVDALLGAGRRSGRGSRCAR